MLEFDAYQRCETAALLLAAFLPERGAAILDAGGYPGRMRARMPEHRWVICDPLVDAPGDQLRGSATALPFADGTFDAAVSLDVLEHIPPGGREDAIGELLRVARFGVVVSFPFNEPWVAEAEEGVCRLYESLNGGRPHPWLSEHREHGLPDWPAVHAVFKRHAGVTHVWDVGEIRRWGLLQMLGVHLEANPGGAEAARAIDEAYRELIYPHEFAHPAYRKIALHLKHPVKPLKPVRPRIPPSAHVSAQMRFDAVWLEALMNVPPPAARDESEGGESRSGAEWAEYANRMELGLRHWEETHANTLRELNRRMAWRGDLERRLSFRIYRKFLKLIGKPLPDK